MMALNLCRPAYDDALCGGHVQNQKVNFYVPWFGFIHKLQRHSDHTAWVTVWQPKPKIRCTNGVMSLSRCFGFLSQSQEMTLVELLVSTKILRTRALATFSSTTMELSRREMRGRSLCSLESMVGIHTVLPFSTIIT